MFANTTIVSLGMDYVEQFSSASEYGQQSGPKEIVIHEHLERPKLVTTAVDLTGSWLETN